MKYLKNDFFIPYYIFEEIIEYVEESAKGKCKSTKWENIKSLLKLAVINNNLSKDEAKYIEKTFCREEVRINE